MGAHQETIAFYAPMKAPTHPHPSGDRTIARLFMQALKNAEYHIDLASIFRSYDRGNSQRQDRLCDIAEGLAQRYCRQVKQGVRPKPQAWFTYHLYHKAPDYIGPVVASMLDIPYVVAEASFAPKQAGGKWDVGHRHVADTLGRADAVVGLNPTDRAMVAPLLKDPRCYHDIVPFLDVSEFKDRASRKEQSGPLRFCVAAMMRDDVKKQSYAYLAQALGKIKEGKDWELHIIGDGPARDEIEGLFRPFGSRIIFHGQCSKQETYALMQQSDVYAWPAIGEAFGMAFLEAQACGLPVVAGRGSAGVAAVVHGTLVPLGQVQDFAEALEQYLDGRMDCEAEGQKAMNVVKNLHSLDQAAKKLKKIMQGVMS